MVLQSELDACAFNLLGHLRAMTGSLAKLTPEQWDWTYSAPAPTPRVIATHTLAWLQCDRQHITNPDVPSHRPIPEPPTAPEDICAALLAEADAWELLLSNLAPADMDRVGLQFAQPEGTMSVRSFVFHMVQNVIYKHGQFATIFFALGLDGDGPYDAPFPNPIYQQLLGIS